MRWVVEAAKVARKIMRTPKTPWWVPTSRSRKGPVRELFAQHRNSPRQGPGLPKTTPPRRGVPTTYRSVAESEAFAYAPYRNPIKRPKSQSILGPLGEGRHPAFRAKEDMHIGGKLYLGGPMGQPRGCHVPFRPPRLGWPGPSPWPFFRRYALDVLEGLAKSLRWRPPTPRGPARCDPTPPLTELLHAFEAVGGAMPNLRALSQLWRHRPSLGGLGLGARPLLSPNGVSGLEHLTYPFTLAFEAAAFGGGLALGLLEGLAIFLLWAVPRALVLLRPLRAAIHGPQAGALGGPSGSLPARPAPARPALVALLFGPRPPQTLVLPLVLIRRRPSLETYILARLGHAPLAEPLLRPSAPGAANHCSPLGPAL